MAGCTPYLETSFNTVPTPLSVIPSTTDLYTLQHLTSSAYYRMANAFSAYCKSFTLANIS